MTALLASLGVLLGSGGLALAAGRWPRLATSIGALGVIVASVTGMGPTVSVLRGGTVGDFSLPWAVPVGEIRLGLDPLTAFFLVPLFVLGAVCAVYGAVYMRAYSDRRSLGPAVLTFNATIAAMLLVLLARNGIVLVFGWEMVTIGAYLLVSFEHDKPEVRRAGWVYLIAGHIAMLCMFGIFLTLGRLAGGFGFEAFLAHRPPAGALASFLFLLALVGFGIKAGIVPLHVWLPEAHAAAPSHVSALMSGVLIKLGLYGLLRTATFLRVAWWWGPSFMVLGLGGGILGISLAAYQRDLKRALAYSSVENIGIILVGLGIGFWGLSSGHPRIGALGVYGALLHVWNHAAVKGLLFLCAGSLLHGAGTKDLERMGGLLRRMPRTGTLMILGAVAIAGLPPLNAFASEWLIYMGLFKGGMGTAGASGSLLLFGAAGLAVMGVLATLCFVRLCGVAVLGQARSPAAEHAHESGPWMVAPMIVLGAAAVAMSLLASRLVMLLPLTAQQLTGASLEIDTASVQLRMLGAMALGLWSALLVVAVVLRLAIQRGPAADATWGCGYVAPTARMQYTAHSFAELMAEGLLPAMLRARGSANLPSGLFPEVARVSTEYTDPLTRSVYEPFFDRWARRFVRLRWLQQGILHVYLCYIVVVVVAALAWVSARRWWWGGS
jgi:hydrogenase-4 component B